MLEPWTREGISFALRSGALAGEAAATDVDGYPAALAACLGAEQDAGRQALAAFTASPAAVHWVMRLLPGMWPLFVRLVAGRTDAGRAARAPADPHAGAGAACTLNAVVAGASPARNARRARWVPSPARRPPCRS